MTRSENVRRPQSRTPKELEARFKQLVRLIEKELETEDQVPLPSPLPCVIARCLLSSPDSSVLPAFIIRFLSTLAEGKWLHPDRPVRKTQQTS